PPIRIKDFSRRERVAQDTSRGKISRPQRKAGSWEWIEAFQTEANPWLSALAEFMFETGARVGQCTALRPRDLDLDGSRVLLPASKDHPPQWITISAEMADTLRSLHPRRPASRNGRDHGVRVFGYRDPEGLFDTWRRACKRAGIEYLTPHQVGRHGFYTELTVRQGLDRKTAAEAGRWSDPALPDRIYAHGEMGDEEIRKRIRTSRVQGAVKKPPNDLKDNVNSATHQSPS
ncbi:MAG: tyrosine-type recombinase/integrase, partial [Pseudomonadota bacterium]